MHEARYLPLTWLILVHNQSFRLLGKLTTRRTQAFLRLLFICFIGGAMSQQLICPNQNVSDFINLWLCLLLAGKKLIERHCLCSFLCLCLFLWKDNIPILHNFHTVYLFFGGVYLVAVKMTNNSHFPLFIGVQCVQLQILYSSLNLKIVMMTVNHT